MSIYLKIPPYEEIVNVDFWVPPQACSLMLSLSNRLEEEIRLDILPTDEGIELLSSQKKYSPPPNAWVDRHIYINEIQVTPDKEVEKATITLLSNLIRDNRLGHKEGLTAIVAKEVIEHYLHHE